MTSDLGIFLIVFAVVGGTELIDRTHFAVIGLSAKQPPLPTWIGAAGAFLITTGIAIVIGATLVDLLGGQLVYLRLGGAALLLGYATYLVLTPSEERTPPSGRSAAATAFLLILLLELGDTTQILEVVFVATFADPLIVFAAGASALATVAAVGCTIGSQLGEKVEPKLLDRIVIVALFVIGIVTIVYALDPGIFPAALG
ncbi:MAG: TMEM165/GDT1 family protein [Thermoplasmata archaeon]|nr:TMEM165/GDT1 family protein [Thermoplasmata archaeon]